MLARISTACAAALLLACTSALRAQDTTFVKQGERVRVKYEQETPVADRSGAVSYRLESVRLVGEVAVLESDTLVLLPEDAGAPLPISLYDIEKIEVSDGKDSNTLLGLGIGAGFGLALGLLACVDDNCHDDDLDFRAIIPIGTTLFFGGVGAGVGALTSGERWREAALPAEPPIALRVGRTGSVRLAFSLRL